MTFVLSLLFLLIALVSFWVFWYLWNHDVKVVLIEQDEFLVDLVEECRLREINRN